MYTQHRGFSSPYGANPLMDAALKSVARQTGTPTATLTTAQKAAFVGTSRSKIGLPRLPVALPTMTTPTTTVEPVPGGVVVTEDVPRRLKWYHFGGIGLGTLMLLGGIAWFLFRK